MLFKMRTLGVCAILLAIMISAVPAWAVNNGDIPVNTPESLMRAIKDLSKTHGAKYKGFEYMLRLGDLTKGGKPDPAALEKLAREALLANPLLDIDKILVIRRRGEANRALILVQRIVEDVVDAYPHLLDLQEAFEAAELTGRTHQAAWAHNRLADVVEGFLEYCRLARRDEGDNPHLSIRSLPSSLRTLERIYFEHLANQVGPSPPALLNMSREEI